MIFLVNDLVKSVKTFTTKVCDVQIISGDLRRYMGCGICFTAVIDISMQHSLMYTSNLAQNHFAHLCYFRFPSPIAMETFTVRRKRAAHLKLKDLSA